MFVFWFLEELLLGSVDEYRFLTCGSIPVPGQSDSENFTQTMDSMAIMGFTPEENICKSRASLFCARGWPWWTFPSLSRQPCLRWSLLCSSLGTFPLWRRSTTTRRPCLITQLPRNCAICLASTCWSSLGPSSRPGLKWVESMCRRPRPKNRYVFEALGCCACFCRQLFELRLCPFL